MKGVLILMLPILTVLTVGCGGTETVRLSGTVEAVQIDLSAEVSGKLVAIEKQEGDFVKEGEVIARIDSEMQRLSVQQYEAVVKMKKAKLAELREGSRTEQIAQGEAAVKIAKANYDSVKSGNRPQQIEQAQANVKAAKARLDGLKSGNRPEQIEQAELAARAAKARVDELKQGNRPEQIEQGRAAVDSALAALETAKTNKSFAQDIYDKTKTLAEAGAVSQTELDEAQNKLQNARLVLESAETGLQNADAALRILEDGATKEAIDIAQANYEQALSQLELMKSGATEQAISEAEGGYELALAQLNLLKAGSTEQAVEAAEGALEQARAQLELLKNGADTQAIVAAEAEVEQSEAALSQARLLLEKCQIKTPVDGTFILKVMEVGDIAVSGACVGTVSDTQELWANLYIPQRNLGMVRLGDALELNAIALPGKVIKGEIIHIADKAEFTPKNIETNDAKENIVFKIKVKILDNIESLKPGMNIDALLKPR